MLDVSKLKENFFGFPARLANNSKNKNTSFYEAQSEDTTFDAFAAPLLGQQQDEVRAHFKRSQCDVNVWCPFSLKLNI